MLRALLTEAGDEEARADVLRELYAITGDESRRSRAISDYRRHYEKTKLHYLLTRIKKLAENGNESGSRGGSKSKALNRFMLQDWP